MGTNVTEFAADVCRGLSATPKELPAKYFYDDVGSALYEAITYLPEYGLTNADIRLLEAHAPDLAAAMPSGFAIAELGSGSGRKTRPVLEAARRRGRMLQYFPIDLSSSALENCRALLAGSACVEPVLASFLEGLARVREEHREPLLVLFVGSSIGNFNPEDACEFLKSVRATLNDQDALLLGVDMVKDERMLVQAYDDATGVTAAFNLNLLARINRELDGDFDLRAFAHEARYRNDPPRIEMHLRATRACEVRVANAKYHFDEGETVLTEKSHKYTKTMLDDLVTGAGLSTEACWMDSEWPFAELLLRPA